MSALRLAAATCLALAAPAPSCAHAAWTRIGAAGPGVGSPRVLAASSSGVIVVRATDAIYQGPGDLTVDVVRPGEPRARQTLRKRLLLDHAAPAGGRVDLLVQHAGSEPALELWQGTADGTARRAWRHVAKPGGIAALARRGSQVAIAWLSYSRDPDVPPRIRLVTGSDRRGLGRMRTVRGLLPSSGARDQGAITDLALGLQRRPVLAVSRWRRGGSQLLLASTAASGRVLTRQVTRANDGLVDVVTTPGGRVGVLLENTGVEGERGECVFDHTQRQIHIAVREPGARRFAPTQRLDDLRSVCSAPRARLVGMDDDGLAVLWGTAVEYAGPEQDAPQAIRVAVAARGKAFGKRAAPWPGARLQSALAAPGGGLLLFAIPAPSAQTLAGPLQLQRRGPDGSVAATETAAPDATDGVLAAVAPDRSLRAGWIQLGGDEFLLFRG